MLVYVTAGPPDAPDERRFFSRTNVERFCAACAMLRLPSAPLTGVAKPPVAIEEYAGRGVDVPLLFWVAMTDASLREASAMICLTFLFRRCGGFQWGVRQGFRTA